MNDAPTDKNTKAAPWLKILLISSLMVNFIIVGLMVGSHFRPPEHMRGPRDMTQGLIGALDFSERRELRQMMRDHGMPARHSAHRNKNYLLQSLRSDTPEQHLRALLEADFERQTRIRRNGQDALIKLISQMDQKTRAEFLARVEKQFSDPE